MNKVERIRPLATYESDFAQWSAEQAQLIREGQFEAVDLENVAEEIESLGRSDKREVGNRIGIVLLHLLKWEFQPSQRKPGWLLTLDEQRDQIAWLLSESPSLKAGVRTSIVDRFPLARRKAADETGVGLKALPIDCLYSIDDVLSQEFLPGEPWPLLDRYRP